LFNAVVNVFLPPPLYILLPFSPLSSLPLISSHFLSFPLISLLFFVGMPLPDSSLDGIVCDIPFGRIYGTPDWIRFLYPLMLVEMHRVVKKSRRIVLLTSQV